VSEFDQKDTLPEQVASDEDVVDASSGEQSELDLGVVATGHEGVDEALSALAGLSDRPVAEHPAVFEKVHRDLDAAMTSLGEDDAGDGPGGPGNA
jgi:hypothetical protein